MAEAETAFHRYHADCMEPWDGPSALVFTDGRLLGASLDRNGLRPCRYVVTDAGVILAGSEVGLADVQPRLHCSQWPTGAGSDDPAGLWRQKRFWMAKQLDRYFEQLIAYTAD